MKLDFSAEVVRLYFNQGRDDAQKIWSIDFGKDTCEILVTAVSVSAVGFSYYDPQVKTGELSAWVQYQHVNIRIIDTTLTIYPMPEAVEMK
jgi:hypothetical protein